jgi:hypothetical protein
MLHVSIHAGNLKDACANNRLDWLDIGYASRGSSANYRCVLFRIDRGALPVVAIPNYPRWSASIWDLVIRAIALSLSAESGTPEEKLPSLSNPEKYFADASSLCAIVKHQSSEGLADRSVAWLQITRDGRPRGLYRAKVSEDRCPDRTAPPFEFRPKFLIPSELVARAALMALTGSLSKLPPRPTYVPPPTELAGGVKYVRLDKLKEPVKTGFLRYLRKVRQMPGTGEDETRVAASAYDGFLETVI